MLRTVESLHGYIIRATDDELGEVKEVYFDDEQWGVRYLVVETGSWLSKRTVLISPYSIDEVDDDNRAIGVSLSREQVKNSPDIDTEKPVSRQHEREYSSYYGYGAYWSGPYLWGIAGYPVYPLLRSDSVRPPEDVVGDLSRRVPDQSEDVHLRSSKQVAGYHILGTDEDIGHVKDFVFDDESWVIRYLLVDTHNWWPGGKKVLLATQWVENVDWSDSTVEIKLTREQIKSSPEYDENQLLNRDYETRLYTYYDRRGYWDL